MPVNFKDANEAIFIIGEPFKAVPSIRYSLADPTKDKIYRNINVIGMKSSFAPLFIERICKIEISMSLESFKKNKTNLALKAQLAENKEDTEDYKNIWEKISKIIEEFEKKRINESCKTFEAHLNPGEFLSYQVVRKIVQTVEHFNPYFVAFFKS